MPQLNQVVRCYSCHRFQVHLVKKAKKWQCKLCNSKQSFKQIFGKGSGKDCRIHAMKLNEVQFMREEKKYSEDFLFEGTKNNEKYENSLREMEFSKSKWVDFLDEQELDESNKKENKQMNLPFSSHYSDKRIKTSEESNSTLVGHINDSYKSYNTGNVQVVNKLDNYVKEVSVCEKDIKEIQKSIPNINKYSEYLSIGDNESKFCKQDTILNEKLLEKNLKIFENFIAEEELDEILRL